MHSNVVHYCQQLVSFSFLVIISRSVLLLQSFVGRDELDL